jgi:hypothetical protein
MFQLRVSVPKRIADQASEILPYTQPALRPLTNRNGRLLSASERTLAASMHLCSDGRMKKVTLAQLAILVLTAVACSQNDAPVHTDQIGDRYEIRLQQNTRSSGGSSAGNSTSRGVLVEEVLSLSKDGIELEFDLPESTSEEYRSKEWIYPVRVFRSWDGGFQLTNEADLEARLKAWLERGEIDRSLCGTWLFTWTAVKIECDPKSAINTIAAFDMRTPNIGHGKTYKQSGGLGESAISADEEGDLIATFAVDAEAVRNQRAESDVVVAEIMGGEPLPLDTALQRRADEEISGTIEVRFKLDPDQRLFEKVTRTDLIIRTKEGEEEKSSITTTLSRSLIEGPSLHKDEK